VQDTIVYDGIAPDAFAVHLKDKTFKNTKRRGKHFWVELDEGPHPIFHLGMTGKFVVRTLVTIIHL
jgi:formamidopyrimidine-DNA glycosylase